MAGIAIGVASLVIAAGGAAEGAHEAHVADVRSGNAKHKAEEQLAGQQKAASEANQQTQAKQAATVALQRQRMLSAGSGGGNWGGTLGTGAQGSGGTYAGGVKTALGE